MSLGIVSGGKRTLQEILDLFEGIRETKDGWDALCPCLTHGVRNQGDRNPSLRIAVSEDGNNLLLKCRVGCLTDDILASIGLHLRDLFGIEGTEDFLYKEKAPKDFDPDERHEAYSVFLSMLTLYDDHRDRLHERGFKDKTIEKAGLVSLYFSQPESAEALHEVISFMGADRYEEIPGFVRKQSGLPGYHSKYMQGLLIPIRDLAGRILGIKVRRDEGDLRYLYFSSPGCSSGALPHIPIHDGDWSGRLWITEGELKAEILHQHYRDPVVSVPGVSIWDKVLPMIKSGINEVVIAFDREDIEEKPPVKLAAKSLYQTIKEGYKDVRIRVADWNWE